MLELEPRNVWLQTYLLMMVLFSPIGQFAVGLQGLSKRTTTIVYSVTKIQESKMVSRQEVGFK